MSNSYKFYSDTKDIMKKYVRGVDEVKQEAAHKEAPKVREDKAR